MAARIADKYGLERLSSKELLPNMELPEYTGASISVEPLYAEMSTLAAPGYTPVRKRKKGEKKEEKRKKRRKEKKKEEWKKRRK
jgi:hypothetical protein